MTQTAEDTLKPGEQVIWRDPRSRFQVMWPFVLVLGALMAVFLGPSGRGYDLLNWRWDAALFPAVAMSTCLIMMWLVEPAAGRLAGGAVTDDRILYRWKGEPSWVAAIPLVDVAAVTVAADGSLEIERREGETVVLPGLRRPQRFAVAAAESAEVPATGLLGRLDRFSENCWWLGGLALASAVELLTGSLVLAGPPWGLVDIAGRVLYGTAALCVVMWIGAHLTCALWLVVLRSRVSAGEVRAWLNTRLQGGHDSRIYRWSLWKSRPYFRLAELLWGEAMDADKGGGSPEIA